MTAKSEQAVIVKTIGSRLRKARELCNLSQSVAAKRLGYTNPSKLSKVEGATDTNSVPLWLIVKAAQIYEVSIDYLFGASDDWEIGSRMSQERDVSQWVFDAWEKARQRDMDVLKRLHNKVDAMAAAIAETMESAENADAAMRRFAEVNPEFQDMRAGARLLSSIERVSDSAKNAKAKMTRFRCECAVASRNTSQLSLFVLND